MSKQSLLVSDIINELKNSCNIDIINNYFNRLSDNYINHRSKNGKTILMVAIEKRWINIAIKLIDNEKCNFDVQDDNGHTAIMYVVFYLQESLALKIIDRLLNSKNKPNLNLMDKKHRTVLMYALQDKSYDSRFRYEYNIGRKDKSIEIAIRLINSGLCNLNLQDDLGRTILMILLESYDLVRIKTNTLTDQILLDHFKDTDLNLQDIEGHTALIYTIKYKIPELEHLLLEKHIASHGTYFLECLSSKVINKFLQKNEILIDIESRYKLLITELVNNNEGPLACSFNSNIGDLNILKVIMQYVIYK
ncbi:MAG: hypothetical protein Edafosvirus2_46 [Edafosvirus sp.]|uniref:Uncharacterized protein n=1 Tax=Edafosvirus sp. TaxID=2487765 RepID=A0A3G4ZSJ8_9VIRU|nr:MAG: hypothetical protein Edafosvirus2_46 [Edafosvirus sp.]